MQGETLFISDLHLDSEYPDIQQQFLQFLAHDAAGSDALYILGDLFEAWLGDDDDSPEHRQVIAGLAAVVAAGTPVFVQHGNRDFLLGERFSRDSSCRLLADPSVIDLYGRAVLIMHGDLLCTDDTAYQDFRKQVREPQWQAQFLQQSLGERRDIARALRQQSREQTRVKAEDIMDVTDRTVDHYMQQFRVDTLIHGHTHRPQVHQWQLHGKHCQRIVLGDWYEQGSVLRWSGDDYELQYLPRV